MSTDIEGAAWRRRVALAGAGNFPRRGARRADAMRCARPWIAAGARSIAAAPGGARTIRAFYDPFDISSVKFATLKDGTRDGQLLVVARDLRTALVADSVAPSLARVLEDWPFYAPQLAELYDSLSAGRARRAFALNGSDCMAPLPRAVRRVAVGRASPGAEPAAIEVAADAQSGPEDDIVCAAQTAVFGARLAAITVDVAANSAPADALGAVRLLTLVNDFVAGASGLATHVATACALVAVTPDELNFAWQGRRLDEALRVERDGCRVQAVEGRDDLPDFGAALALAARLRPLGAGTMLTIGAMPAMEPSRDNDKTLADVPADNRVRAGQRVRLAGVGVLQGVLGTLDNAFVPDGD
jgi:fumarylacetoacetate (FAA) hydrolase